MADVALKKIGMQKGATVREQLRALDDSAVVTAFLDGEERAFQELVDLFVPQDGEHGAGGRSGMRLFKRKA